MEVVVETVLRFEAEVVDGVGDQGRPVVAVGVAVAVGERLYHAVEGHDMGALGLGVAEPGIRIIARRHGAKDNLDAGVGGHLGH